MNNYIKVVCVAILALVTLSGVLRGGDKALYEQTIERLKGVGSDDAVITSRLPGGVDADRARGFKENFDSVAKNFTASDVSNLIFLARDPSYSDQKLDDLWSVGQKAMWVLGVMRLKSGERETVEGLIIEWLADGDSPLRKENYNSYLVRLTFNTLGRVSGGRGKQLLKNYMNGDSACLKGVDSTRAEDIRKKAVEGFSRVRGNDIRQELEGVRGSEKFRGMSEKNGAIDLGVFINDAERKYIVPIIDGTY